MRQGSNAAGEILSPEWVFGRYYTSEYGQSLSGRPRWDRYRPEHVDPTEWRRLLGSDADNLQHMRLSHGIVRHLLREDDGSFQLDEQEKAVLLLAAMIHDWGKGSDYANGRTQDISYDLKTVDDAEYERAMFAKVFQDILPHGDVKLKYLVESAIFDPDSKLGTVFNAMERLGYLRTAMIAYCRSHDVEGETLPLRLRWLAANVLSNQILPLLTYAEAYLPIAEYLNEHREMIDEMFGTIGRQIFEQNGQIERKKVEDYEHSRLAWSRVSSIGGVVVDRNGGRPKGGVLGREANYEARIITDYKELAAKVEACRTLGMRIVLTSGSFDMLHIGHMRYLEKAKQHGDILVVGVDSDAKIQERKGPDRPVIEEGERLRMLAHHRDVDMLTLKYPSSVKWELIKRVRPDILIATAETYSANEIKELEEKYCGRVVVLEPQATTSTSARIRKLNISWADRVTNPIVEAIERGLSGEELKEYVNVVLAEARNG